MNKYKPHITERFNSDFVYLKMGVYYYNLFFHNCKSDFKTFFFALDTDPKAQEFVVNWIVELMAEIDKAQ